MNLINDLMRQNRKATNATRGAPNSDNVHYTTSTKASKIICHDDLYSTECEQKLSEGTRSSSREKVNRPITAIRRVEPDMRFSLRKGGQSTPQIPCSFRRFDNRQSAKKKASRLGTTGAQQSP